MANAIEITYRFSSAESPGLISVLLRCHETGEEFWVNKLFCEKGEFNAYR